MTDVTCHGCGYEWTYSGDMAKATCPSCNVKTRVDADE
jgi:rubrerythrin